MLTITSINSISHKMQPLAVSWGASRQAQLQICGANPRRERTSLRAPGSQCKTILIPSDTLQVGNTSLTGRIREAGCAIALAGLAVCSPIDPSYATPVVVDAVPTYVTVDNNHPILDLARVIPSGKSTALQDAVLSLEADTGWRVRMLTRFGPSNNPSIEQLRSGWSVDDKTVVVFVDPSAPNIFSFKYGLAVQQILPRPFFTELQSRYGNMFFVRENGEQAAIDGAMDGLLLCLRKGGCRVPPGLPQDQYVFTLLCSVAGGFILGSALRLEPQGFVKRQWVYGLLFAPLWATLAINFGLGPVVSRTQDILPIAANILATIAAACLIKFYPQAAQATGLTVDEPMNSDWE